MNLLLSKFRKFPTAQLFLTGLLSSSVLSGNAVANADTKPIEPVLVPISSAADNINIQMGKYEVTVAEFTRFINATGYQVPKKCMLFSSTSWPSPETPGSWDNPELIADPYRPAVCIGTLAAMAYADWLAKTTGKPYRLAERNEWKYAASEGKESRFAFGEDVAQTQICDYENVEDFATIAGLKRDHKERYDSSASCNDGAVYQTVVGMYRPNKFGLHDMIGNVKELLQTCHKQDEKDPSSCVEYEVAGEAWHWQARGVDTPDWIAVDFIGSIEGFRLVLDSHEKAIEPSSTKAFTQELLKAQIKARKAHNVLKTLPSTPSGLTAKLSKGNKVNLTWLPVSGDGVSYSIYRSYLDPKGQLSRKSEKIVEGVKNAYFVDQLPAKGAASYTVFASSAVGESMGSEEAFVGEHSVYKIGERIQAEQYNQQFNTWIRDKKQEESVGIAASDGHYPTGRIPFVPGWLKFNFKSDYTGEAKLKMRIRSQKDALVEIWQGHHLAGRFSGGDQKTFSEIDVKVSLIKGELPLEIRAANQKWNVIDWFEFEREEK
ncbi:formylglycine-generating enzyme family protein [Aliikangiella coralliicola]|uniref:Formylglycine-generating enzyme family protein n=1 Tax=Aliikangiella coralliicola TaxID=2592383 RepID=A0A545UGZ1_9GAMM|nr:SUMF1/EgtB/PvdO family nonheme iron enzyme [Aliikangiella coralliicola]TQV88737.1 formylglycine-generating enzyme family protein [Aliikangiella coralliicola]